MKKQSINKVRPTKSGLSIELVNSTGQDTFRDDFLQTVCASINAERSSSLEAQKQFFVYIEIARYVGAVLGPAGVVLALKYGVIAGKNWFSSEELGYFIAGISFFSVSCLTFIITSGVFAKIVETLFRKDSKEAVALLQEKDACARFEKACKNNLWYVFVIFAGFVSTAINLLLSYGFVAEYSQEAAIVFAVCIFISFTTVRAWALNNVAGSAYVAFLHFVFARMPQGMEARVMNIHQCRAFLLHILNCAQKDPGSILEARFKQLKQPTLPSIEGHANYLRQNQLEAILHFGVEQSKSMQSSKHQEKHSKMYKCYNVGSLLLQFIMFACVVLHPYAPYYYSKQYPTFLFNLDNELLNVMCGILGYAATASVGAVSVKYLSKSMWNYHNLVVRFAGPHRKISMIKNLKRCNNYIKKDNALNVGWEVLGLSLFFWRRVCHLL